MQLASVYPISATLAATKPILSIIGIRACDIKRHSIRVTLSMT